MKHFVVGKIASCALAVAIVGSVWGMMASKAEAADYWVYTNSSGVQYYVTSEKSMFIPKMGNQHAYVKLVYPDGYTAERDLGFGYSRNTTKHLEIMNYTEKPV